MEIRGDKAYLSIREQQTAELPSPIRFGEIDVAVSLRVSEATYQSASQLVHADPNEGLPHERANALKQMSVYDERRKIYKKIASELIVRGQLDLNAIHLIS